MNNFISTLAIAAVTVFAASNASAATIYNNQSVTEVAVGSAYGGDVVIRLSGHASMTKPACSTDGYWSLRFDGTTEAGKQAYSMAILAQSTGATLALSGEDTCIDSVQELRWIRLK